MVNKLNIIKKPKKNYKLTLTALGLSIILGSCSAGTLKIFHRAKAKKSPLLTTNVNESNNFDYSNMDLNYFINDIDDEVYLRIINSHFIEDENNQTNFEDVVSGISINYSFSELFGINEFFNQYYSISNEPSNFSREGIITKNKVNLEKLRQTVIDNNDCYLNENSGIAKKYSDTTDKLVIGICEIVANYLSDYLNDNPKVDINGLEEKLSNLKIFESSTFSYAYYNADSGILGISSSAINALRANTGDDFTFEKVVEHEVNHILQAATESELSNSNYDIRYGPCYHFENLKVNCGYWNWFFEASAESMTCKYNNTQKSLTFPNDITCMKIVSSSTIINNYNSVDKFVELSLQSDLDMIFDYFNCHSIADKEEVMKLMYSFNIINQDTVNSSTQEFHDLYEEKYGKRMDYSSRLELNYSLYSSIAQSLSKYFYRDLVNHIVNKEVSLEEIFFNIYVMEQNLHRLTKYSQVSRANGNYDFFQNYIIIQDSFFELISNCINMSFDDIKLAYFKYFKEKDKSINISYLDKEKNVYYLELLESNPSLITTCIAEEYNVFLQSGIYNTVRKK